MNCAILTEESVLPRQEGNAMAAAAVGGRLREWAERSALRRADRLTAGGPVPGRLRFVFYGRVSTEDWQDPVTSRARQREQAGALVRGHGQIVAEFFDVGPTRKLAWACRRQSAALAGIDPDAISFTAVLGLVRAHLQAGTRCEHCGRRPDEPLARLLADVIAHPRNRTGRKRTSGRTPAERRTRHTEEATYTITIMPSNLPQWDKSLGS